MTYKPQRLSEKAFQDLKAITEKEIQDPMADDEIEEMGVRLLQLFDVIMKPVPEKALLKPTEEEAKALHFIQEELRQGRNPSARSLAKALGLRSSRSGLKRIDVLISKGFVIREGNNILMI